MEEITPHYCAYWKEIGMLLNIPQGVLESIEHEYAHGYRGLRRCCNEMFMEWDSRDISASWKKLHAVLKSPAIKVEGNCTFNCGLPFVLSELFYFACYRR